jgi:hypothetical protein
MFENMADQVLCLPAPFDVFAPDCFPDEPPVVLPPFDIRAAGLAATCGLDRLCTSFWAIFVPAEPGAPEGAHCGDNAGISATVPTQELGTLRSILRWLHETPQRQGATPCSAGL